MKNFFYLLVIGSIASGAMAATLTHKARSAAPVAAAPQQGVTK